MFGIGERPEPPVMMRWKIKYIDVLIMEGQDSIPIQELIVLGKNSSEAHDYFWRSITSHYLEKHIKIVDYQIIGNE